MTRPSNFSPVDCVGATVRAATDWRPDGTFLVEFIIEGGDSRSGFTHSFKRLDPRPGVPLLVEDDEVIEFEDTILTVHGFYVNGAWLLSYEYRDEPKPRRNPAVSVPMPAPGNVGVRQAQTSRVDRIAAHVRNPAPSPTARGPLSARQPVEIDGYGSA